MSRVGKIPIEWPEGVTAQAEKMRVRITGKRGELSLEPHGAVEIRLEGKTLLVTPTDNSSKARAMWGTSRALLQNMVTGVSVGFSKKLELNGVGYRAKVGGKTLNLTLGYSHPIDFPLPSGIEAKVSKNIIEITGSDKELVGRVAAKIRSLRPPEPYKGKGVKYVDERIIMKAGKAGVKKA